MQDLSILEIQNLKNLISLQEVNFKKMTNYSDYSVDPQIKQIFSKAAQNSLNCKEKLLEFLN